MMNHALVRQMLLPNPFCNHQPSSLPPKTLPNPSLPIFFFYPSPLSQNPNKPSKPLLHRTSASATQANSQTLPKSAIQRIADKLRSLGYVDDDNKDGPKKTLNSNTNRTSSPGEIFIPLPDQLPKHRVGHTIDSSWSTPENPVPEPGSGSAIQRFHELRREVWKEKVKRKGEERERKNVPTLAELTVPEEELRRLRTIGIGLKKKLKVGKAGITEGIVNGIHERWRRTELVKIACEDLCRMNMKRTHELLERKTGGLVIWRSGSNIILYRGANYKYPYFFSDNNSENDTSATTSSDSRVDCGVHVRMESYSSGTDGVNSAGPNSSSNKAQPPLIQGVGSPNRVRFQLPGEAQLAEEADRLLDGLGPRFTDWWGYDPLPIDADLLPAAFPGYRRPFRLLPFGVKPKLTNDEMTTLKRLGRPLPCHFVLGRNRRLQGLAAKIVKLWEKCEIAKIAVKRGVQNTNSELMAEELKRLTGGTLLSRDKEYIIFYRGKDFLPAAASLAIEERRKYGIHGEKQVTDDSTLVMAMQDHKFETVQGGSEDECNGINDQKQNHVSERRKPRSIEAAIERTSTKLQTALAKKDSAEKLLAELEKEMIPQEPEIDKEGITKEERYMLRKVGLRMKPFLLLGRRGVFDGTIENMHLHWKYRELVKIIFGGRSTEEVYEIARTLEAESGGILVAVERVSKGYAIIMYRGKNYERPTCLRPRTLLSKREAMKRSKEAQRRESLKLHVLKLGRNIDVLKLQLAKDKETNSVQSAKGSELQLVKEQKTNGMQLTENKRSDTELETNYHSSIVSPACNLENVEARERYGVDSTFFNSNDGMVSSSDTLEITQRDILADSSLKYKEKEVGKFDLTEAEVVFKEINVVMDMNGEGGDVEPANGPDNIRVRQAFRILSMLSHISLRIRPLLHLMNHRKVIHHY
ncbi:CRM-domain containing factor CFM2, chloroplastic isoform X2 [Cornus florida]|uniref:CRM-domain containing factor CFM2, chloroplastic isoform X2 n=1 Tax=Cornus florida TaxID=4283 RepID=UPI0028A288D1|nr:CRM-domain containing factor CFM2, chloroplastic isoform X2 [Cornus florida]